MKLEDLYFQKLDSLANIANPPAATIDEEIEKELSEDEVNPKDTIYGEADEADEEYDDSRPPDDFGMEDNEEEQIAKKPGHSATTTPEQYAENFVTAAGVAAWPHDDVSLNMTKAKVKADARARSRSPHTGAAAPAGGDD